MTISPFDRENLSWIMAGHGDWFTAHLLRLIKKADPQHRARLALGFPDEVWAVEKWEIESSEDIFDSGANDVDESNLGSCCACGKTGKDVRAIVMLDKRGPKPGHGWGCAQCGLPMDGAVYVLCDACFNAKAEAKFVCVGYPKENVRIPIAEITEPFDHDMSKHPEADLFAAAQREH